MAITGGLPFFYNRTSNACQTSYLFTASSWQEHLAKAGTSNIEVNKSGNLLYLTWLEFKQSSASSRMNCLLHQQLELLANEKVAFNEHRKWFHPSWAIDICCVKPNDISRLNCRQEDMPVLAGSPISPENQVSKKLYFWYLWHLHITIHHFRYILLYISGIFYINRMSSQDVIHQDEQTTENEIRPRHAIPLKTVKMSELLVV